MLRTRWGGSVLAALLCCGASWAQAEPLDLEVQYVIDVRYDPEDKTLAGHMLVSIKNHTDEALNDIVFFLYPNLYREEPTGLDRAAVEKIYPRAFDPGAMAVVAAKTLEGTPLDFVIEPWSNSPSHTVARATLGRPLDPEGVVDIRLSFVTFIPEKFGVFGYFRGVTALKGGWHPYVAARRDGRWMTGDPPSRAAFSVNVTTPAPIKLVGATLVNGEELDPPIRQWHISLVAGRSIPLIFSQFFQERQETTEDGVRISYAYLPGDQAYVPRVMSALRSGLAFFRAHYGNIPLSEVQAAEAYLHQEVVAPDRRVLFVAVRTLKVFGPLKKYHETELVKSLFYMLWSARVPDEEDWVIEGLAEATVSRYSRERYQRQPSLVRLLKPLAFLPVVDQILYSDRLPLRQVYFQEAAPIVPREDPSLFNNMRPQGGTIFFKLTALIGTDVVNNVLDAYVARVGNGDQPQFRAVLQEETGLDLGWFYRQWLEVNPETDFAISSVRRERRDDGHHTTISLTKDGGGIEPVTVRLLQRDDSEISTTWLSYGPDFEETFVTPSPVSVIELDPDHKTSDPERFNDRTPPAIKFIWEKLPGLSYDFQTEKLSYDVSAYFQRRYDEHNIVRLIYTNNEIESGWSISAAHDYQARIASYSSRQSVSLGFVNSRRFEPLTPGGPTEVLNYVQAAHVVSNAKTSLVYPEEIQQLFYGAIPYSTLSTVVAHRVTSKRVTAARFQLTIRNQWAFETLHEVAGRLSLGESVGNFDELRQYELGGSGGMRGYSPGSLSGTSIALGSIEYRRPLIREIDTDVWGWSLLRRLQGVIFADIGAVASSGLRKDVGIGLRLTHEVLGLYPIVTRIDVAYPLRVEEELQAAEERLHWYITAGQPF